VPERAKPIEDLVASIDSADLTAAADDSRLTPDLALALLQKRDLPPRAIELVSRNRSVLKHRTVNAAIAAHPRTPRWVAVPVLRRMFTFELMQIASAPAVAPHVKMVANEVIVSRLESISAGERMTLAKQGSRALASVLLSDAEPRISEAALDSPRLAEGDVVKALMQDDAPQHLIVATARHTKWRTRNEVQAAILKHPQCPLACAVEIADYAPESVLRSVLANSRLADEVKNYVAARLNGNR
jgi:hypothetical protein